MLPNVINYGRYSSDNYGVNSLKLDLGEIEIYYSYKTIVAYCDGKDGLICSQNKWGVTTGKHLNWIEPNHNNRKNHQEFEIMLISALERHIR